jgi:hypothetical protein
MKAIIMSTLARIQRDQKVVLHHFIFEGSHAHIVCTAKDALLCQRFYGELKKQLTDSIKRLAGLNHLSIWGIRANVSEIPSIEDAILKIAYVYTNPSNDSLCNCIEDYPGVSSWCTFQGTPIIADSYFASEYAWIQQPHISKLPCRSLSLRQDRRIVKEMLNRAESKHELRIYPHSWLNCFIQDPSEEDVSEANKGIVSRVRKIEATNAQIRQKQRRAVVGAAALRTQPLLKPHKPKKQGRKIFVQSISRTLRIALIRERKLIEALCRAVYQRWASGDFTVCWPPGTFPPPLPPMASAI